MESIRTPVGTQAASSTRSQQLLIQTGLLLAQERDLRKIVQAATDAGRELCGAQFGAFFYNVMDASGESYLLYTLSGVPAEHFAHFPMARNTEVFGPTFAGQGVVRSADITRDPRYGKSGPHYGMPQGHLPVRSYLAVSVVSRSGEVLGGLFFGHADADVFVEESEDLVQTVAAQAAVAIDNFRLREQLTRRIHDAQIAQAQQKKEAQRVREVLETTSDAVVLLDRGWIIRYISQRAVRLIAGGRDLLGQNLWQVFAEAVDSRFHHEYHRVMNDRQPREFIEFYPPLGGWFSIRAFPTEEGIAIFFRDVTQAMEDDRARQENARRLRLALDAGQLGTWTWNRETDLLDLDHRAAAIYEREAHRPVTRTEIREQVVVPEDRELIAAALRRSIETGGTYTGEYRIQRKDGGVGWILAHGVTLFDGDDSRRITGMIGTVQDITARKLQEQALRDSEKLAATGRMAATIAHEINNPLEAVTNLIFLARTNPAAAPEIREQLDIADQELRRVSQIAQQTLGFYRDTSRPVRVDLGEAIHDVVAIFQRRLQSRRIDCVLDFRGSLHLLGQRGEIRQVLSNLLVNAIDASPTPGAITVRVRGACLPAGDPAVSILVCDRGSGIPASVRKSLFAPFFTTKREVGTGLGLWITKGIVEKHRGSIRFRTRTHRDPGTVFRILLPTNLQATSQA